MSEFVVIILIISSNNSLLTSSELCNSKFTYLFPKDFNLKSGIAATRTIALQAA